MLADEDVSSKLALARDVAFSSLQWPPANEKEPSLTEQPLRLIGRLANDGPSSTTLLWDESRRCFAFHWPGILAAVAERRGFFDALLSTAPWRELVGFNGEVTRSTCWYVREPCTCDYTYGSDRISMQRPAEGFVALMEELTEHVFEAISPSWPREEFPDSANLNLYEDDSQSVGWHADDESLFAGKREDCAIVSLSLGGTREFWLRLRDADSARRPEFCSTLEVDLADGDVLSMEGLCQRHTVHHVPTGPASAHSGTGCPRINITWRWIKEHKKKCPLRTTPAPKAGFESPIVTPQPLPSGVIAGFWADPSSTVRWHRQCDVCRWRCGRNCVKQGGQWVCRLCLHRPSDTMSARELGPSDALTLEYLERVSPRAVGLPFQRPDVSSSRLANFQSYYPDICDVKTWQVVWSKLLTPSPLTVKVVAAGEFAGVLPRSMLLAALQQFASEAGATIRKLPSFVQGCWFEITAPSDQWCATGQLQELLLMGESVGLLHVRDIVSALPCFFADPSAEVILDLCAAQGAHGLEHLQQHCGDKERMLIANEVDTTSASPLKDRIQYQPCVARGVLVTTVDPASFPVLRSSELQPPGTVVQAAPALSVDELSATWGRYWSHQAALAATNPWWQERRTQYDLIFANVPCGGDGLARTKPETLARWSTARGLALFPKQLAILRRGLQLLRPGGHLIYSTRSLDPVQNEAVVAAAMCLHNAHEATTVCLQDVAARLAPEIADALLPGLPCWGVPGSDFSSACPRLFRTWSELPQGQATTQGPRPHREMFPNFSGGLAEDCVKCRRAVPCAALDSGCLFLARIHKIDPQHLKRNKKTVFAPRCHPIFKPARSVNGLDPEKGCILKFFGLHSKEEHAAACGVSRFPLELVALAPASRDVLVLRSSAGEPLQEHKELKTVGGGLPLLKRVASGGRFFQHELPGQVFDWRPLPEAVGILGRCCTRRLVSLPPALLAALLTDLELGSTRFPRGASPAATPGATACETGSCREGWSWASPALRGGAGRPSSPRCSRRRGCCSWAAPPHGTGCTPGPCRSRQVAAHGGLSAAAKAALCRCVHKALWHRLHARVLSVIPGSIEGQTLRRRRIEEEEEETIV
ncbi:unnamed protein product [Prorocentrum cordatum]|uniref:Uncharacterized protein n=1 Tax=Prorocentrum cordatum TaxID=2364126 RepID=A0ABN9UAR6_9DINO|nr:unnamed protein product [Polarella glacialis]